MTPQEAPNKQFTPDPEREARRIDRRVERLEEKLEQGKSWTDELKDRLSRAEQTARDADRRQISELNKAEAAVRDLQHSLRSERRAYKILQLQYEAQLERVRAAEANSTQAPAIVPPETAEDDTPVAVAETTETEVETSTDSAAAEPTEAAAEPASATSDAPSVAADPAETSDANEDVTEDIAEANAAQADADESTA